MPCFTRLDLRARLLVLSAMAVLAVTLAAPSQGATLPTGFAETQVATGLAAPTAMTFSPDGRLFVTEQGGRLRVIKNGTLLATPFVTLNVNAVGERGLLGVAFDPNFAFNQFVYVYYTTASAPIHNRVSRFTAMGDVAAAGSEVVILELENLSSATNHNGGAIHFGPDGTLFVAVGENANGANAQTLDNRLGKILRLHPDGAIPTSNPFFNTATGANRAIWALGLRNPLHLRVPARLQPNVHQRRRPEHVGGDQRRNRGLELRLARHRRSDHRSPLPLADLLVRARVELDDGLRHQRRRLLQPGRPCVSRATTPATTSSRTTAAAGSAGSIRPTGMRSRGSQPESPARSTWRSRAMGVSTTWRAAPAGQCSAWPTPQVRRPASRPIRQAGRSRPERRRHSPWPPAARRRSRTSGSGTASTFPALPPRATRSRP